MARVAERVPAGAPDRWVGTLRVAIAEPLDQEFAPGVGHVATVLIGCTFAPSLLTFWAVNGVLDFSVAALELAPATVADLLAVFNSLLTGPAVVALFALVLDRVPTRPELVSLPLVRHTLPERDPAASLASAAVGTAFYLGLVLVVSGEVGLVP